MAEKNGIYKCDICGNVVNVIEAKMGELNCCGQPMDLLVAKTEDIANEKHVPIIEINNNHVSVKVGDVPHPMEEKHFIELIQLLNKNGNVIASASPKPGEKPEAVFYIKDTDGISAREYCNVHGLWKSK